MEYADQTLAENVDSDANYEFAATSAQNDVTKAEADYGAPILPASLRQLLRSRVDRLSQVIEYETERVNQGRERDARLPALTTDERKRLILTHVIRHRYRR